MRLFSAIPLLFWVGTAAVAHLAHVWALVPPAVAPVAQAAETASGPDFDAAVHAAAMQFLSVSEGAPVPAWPAPAQPCSGAVPTSPDGYSASLQRQILSAVRLSGNPPPVRAQA